MPETKSSHGWRAHLPEGFDPKGLDLLAAGSLPAAWRRLAEAGPDRPALWAGDRGWVSRGELDAAGARVAGRLRRAGLAAGDRVLVSAATSMDLVVAYLGALRMGLVVVPVNTAYREREVAHVVGDARPAAAVVDDPERGRWARRAAGGDLLVAGPEVDLPDGDPPPLDAGHPGDPALLCYTSGTTGAPKGAVLAHGNLLASAEALRLAWRWTPDDRLVLALPLFHVHGLGVGLHGTLLAGASAVLLPRFEVDGVLDAARDHRATLFFGVPTMYARLAGSPRAGELGRCGTPSEEWGEQVTAFVVPADPAAPPDRDELLAFAAERLASFKRPRVLHYVEALPRNALGKVLKHELRA